MAKNKILISGIILLIVGIIMGFAQMFYILPKNAVTTKGIILDSSEVQTRFSRRVYSAYKEIFYAYSDEYGNTYKKYDSISYLNKNSLNKKFLKNTEITITYDRSNPENVIIGEPKFLNQHNILCFTLGTICIIIGIILRKKQIKLK